MKKKLLSKLTVKRISTSPYFKESFAQLEKKIIEINTEAEMLPYNSLIPANILITNTHTNVEQISLSDKSHCQLMIHPNSGYDNLTADFVSSADFPIVIGNPIRAQAVTNFIFCALLSHYSAIPHTKSWDASRKWPRTLISELNILILGMGHIGKLLKSSLTPLASSVQVYDPYLHHNDLNLKNIDVIIPACSLNTKNKHIINRDFLLALNEDFLLINAARGDLVNTKELIDVLTMRPLAHAVLDVFEKEPCDLSLFQPLKNISLSSHIAGVYAHIDQATVNFEAQVIADFTKLAPEEFDQLYESILLKNRLQSSGFLI